MRWDGMVWYGMIWYDLPIKYVELIWNTKATILIVEEIHTYLLNLCINGVINGFAHRIEAIK